LHHSLLHATVSAIRLIRFVPALAQALSQKYIAEETNPV